MQLKERSSIDRRSGDDRRKFPILKKLFAADPHHRETTDRRSTNERREGWVRLTKWSSMNLSKLKISKFLKPY